jgi:hypothetical protein
MWHHNNHSNGNNTDSKAAGEEEEDAFVQKFDRVSFAISVAMFAIFNIVFWDTYL